eukprot:2405651-Prymnesium_polylepis.1
MSSGPSEQRLRGPRAPPPRFSAPSAPLSGPRRCARAGSANRMSRGACARPHSALYMARPVLTTITWALDVVTRTCEPSRRSTRKAPEAQADGRAARLCLLILHPMPIVAGKVWHCAAPRSGVGVERTERSGNPETKAAVDFCVTGPAEPRSDRPLPLTTYLPIA